MPKPYSYGEINEKGREVAGKFAATSTSKVNQEGPFTLRLEHHLLHRLCQSSQSWAGPWSANTWHQANQISSFQAAWLPFPGVSFRISPFYREEKQCCLLAEAVLWQCVFLQGAISLACKHWTFTCLLALGHFPNFGFFHTMSKAHSCFGTAEALAGQKKLFGPSAQLRVLQSLCAPGVCAGTVWLVGWQHSAHSSISMDPDANFCPILGSSHCISDNTTNTRRKRESTWRASPPVICSCFFWA